MSQRELIRKKTRIEFRECLVGWILREIRDVFSAQGFEPDMSYRPDLNGDRRVLVEQYYHNVDFTSRKDVDRIIRVYADILACCKANLGDAGTNSYFNTLLNLLKEDGYRYEDGKLRIRYNDAMFQYLMTKEEVFDSDYLTSQLDRLSEAVEHDPDYAIGGAKDLIESCCRTILSEYGENVKENTKLNQLVKTTRERLRLLPEDMPENAKGKKSIEMILGNLGSITQGIAELRNFYGSGHGRPARHRGLKIRHARLAVGAATTLTVFLLDTHAERVSKDDVTVK